MTATGTVGDRTPDDVARGLFAALGLAEARLHSRVDVAGGPPTSGTVVHAGPRVVTVRTDDPHPGLVELAVFAHAGATVMIRGYLFGEGAASVAERETPRWTARLAAAVPGLRPLTPSG